MRSLLLFYHIFIIISTEPNTRKDRKQNAHGLFFIENEAKFSSYIRIIRTFLSRQGRIGSVL